MTKDTREDARASIVSHICGSTDERHRGVGYNKATMLLNVHGDAAAPGSEPGSQPGSEPSPETADVDDPSSEPGSTTTAATDGGRMAPPEPELEDDAGADHAGSDGTGDPTRCPGCGDTEDTRPIGDLVERLPDGFDASALDQHDYFCPSCTRATDDGMVTEAWSA